MCHTLEVKEYTSKLVYAFFTNVSKLELLDILKVSSFSLKTSVLIVIAIYEICQISVVKIESLGPNIRASDIREVRGLRLLGQVILLSVHLEPANTRLKTRFQIF